MSEFGESHSDRAAEPKDNDRRLYVLDQDWSVAVNRGSTAHYCYLQNPGEDYFHLILDGEVYLNNSDEKLCLNCALRQGILTTDRQFWQHRTRAGQSRL